MYVSNCIKRSQSKGKFWLVLLISVGLVLVSARVNAQKRDSTLYKMRRLNYFAAPFLDFGASPSGLIVNKVRLYVGSNPLPNLDLRMAVNGYYGKLPGVKGEAIARVNITDGKFPYFFQVHFLLGSFLSKYETINSFAPSPSIQIRYTTPGYALSFGKRFYLDKTQLGYLEFIFGLQNLKNQAQTNVVWRNRIRYVAVMNEREYQLIGPGAIAFFNVNLGLRRPIH